MTFIVTGATGFLGYEFVSRALQGGHFVYAVCRNETKAHSLFSIDDRLCIVKADIYEFIHLPEKIKHADVFVNFAWDGLTVSGREWADVQKMSTKFAIDAFLASKQLGCKVFVEAGSQAEYGIVDDEITEETSCCPFSEYGKAKLSTWNQCSILSEDIGVKYIHCRIFSVFGKRDHDHTLIHYCINRFTQNEPVELSTCTHKWNFLYVKDAVKQMLLLSIFALDAKTLKPQIFNIASDDTRVLRDYIEDMKRLFHSSSIIKYGAIVPTRIVPLNPCINKLKTAINFVADYNFSEALLDIIS